MLFSLFSHQHILFPVQYSVKKLVSISYLPGCFERLFTLPPMDFMSQFRVCRWASFAATLVLETLECSYLINLFVILLLCFCLSDTGIRQNLLLTQTLCKDWKQLRMLFPHEICDLLHKHDLCKNYFVKFQRSGVMNHYYLLQRKCICMVSYFETNDKI